MKEPYVRIFFNGPKGVGWAEVPAIKDVTQENEMPGDMALIYNHLYQAYRFAKQQYDDLPEPKY